jgi:hypothetical protein
LLVAGGELGLAELPALAVLADPTLEALLAVLGDELQAAAPTIMSAAATPACAVFIRENRFM